MRKKKPEELEREREKADASRRKSGTPSHIPPSPHSGPLNSESLRITLPELPDIRTRKQLPKDLARRLIAEDNERMENPPDMPWYRPHPLAKKKDEEDA